MRCHGTSALWPGRKKETSCERQDSLQETGRKDGWAKCQELVSIGISSCWSLRSSCRAGWIASLPSTSMATSPLPEPDSGPLWFPQGFLSCYRVAERLTMRPAHLLSRPWTVCVPFLFLTSSFIMFLRSFLFTIARQIPDCFILVSLSCHQWLSVTHLVHNNHNASGTLIKHISIS